MKQHITKKQWKELSDDDKSKFDLSWDILSDEFGFIAINIGQMIEFLEKDHAVKIDQWMDEWRAWRVGLDWLDGDIYEYVCEDNELVDALWLAVKYKLEIIEAK